MELPTRDVRFLSERGYDWNVASDGGGAYLVVKKFGVSGGGFAPAETDLMIRIPPQYPITPLDMWYCHPTIRLASTGQFAPASEVVEAHLGKTWQRFSRHLNGTWKPGVDGLRSFFVLIQRELQGLGRS
jgi:E2/UBC family protein E